jgi:uncharacterized membrane protein AbrB (regulator of aidB expression)
LLAAVPGSLAYILTISLSVGADPPRVAIVQMIRVIFLVVLLPIIVVMESDAHLAPVADLINDPPWMLAGTAVCSALLGLLFLRFKMGGGMMYANGGKPDKFAQGGAGKVRKGMMTPEGKIIHAMNKVRGK